MEEYRKLLEKFEHIPRIGKRSPTFMEISGYPHFENVCSNILAFFFDTEEQHDFKDLFLKSLMSIVDPHGLEEDLSTAYVFREELTSSGKRIDLIIETENMVVGIENKIWAPLHNSLADYSSFLDTKYRQKKRYKVVLSLNPIPEIQLTDEFVNVTHNALLSKVKEGLGKYLFINSTKYLFQLLDFIETMQNHFNTSTMKPETLDFFIQEKELIDNFLSEHQSIQHFIYNKLKGVQNIINQRIDEEEINLEQNRQWVWRKFDLVHDFSLKNDLVIAVDSTFEVDGINIRISVRKGSLNKIDTLNKLKIAESNPKRVNESFVIIEKGQMELLTPDEKIADTILNVLKKIHFPVENEVIINSATS